MKKKEKDELASFEKLDVVKKYFARIFTVLHRDLRKDFLRIDFPKSDQKKLLKELAFLTKEEQLIYLDEMREIYGEKSQ